MKDTLEVDSVNLEFGTKRVLKDVYLKCETGKITGLLGRNGTGKSCLIRIMFGQLKAGYSSVRLNGKVLLNKTRQPENMMFLPQFNFIPSSLTIKRIFKDFKLSYSEFIHHFPEYSRYCNYRLKQLSSGERRIVEIYSILLSGSKFCLLDEPFSQVMPVHVETIKNLMNKQKVYKGILITDHLYGLVIIFEDISYSGDYLPECNLIRSNSEALSQRTV